MSKILLFAALFAATLAAQDTGSFYGTVTDPSGGVIANARITATSTERGNARNSTANDKGQWILTLMPIGTYSIKIEAPGFKSFDRQAIALGAEDNVKVDAALEVGNTSETITVTAETSQVDSRSSTLGATIDEKMLLDMPLDGRNIFDLTTLLPGVSSVSDPQTFTNDRQGPTFTTSGSRTAQNNMTFDGTLYVALFRNTGLNYPPPDAIAEVHVLTANYTAEYGRESGTSMNVITKSGTNALHGSVWEFIRNNDFNARSFFSKTVNKLVQNQYGATLGGPIIRNKLFLFGSYQGLKVRTAALSSSAKPLTSAESSGEFTTKITDPLTGQLFPLVGKNYTIPASRFDPVALKLNALIEPSNSANGTLVATYASPQDDDQGLMRGDYYWGKHAIDARYYQVASRDQKSSGNVPSYERIADNTSYHTASLGDTLPITPSLLNVARLAYNRFGGTVDVLTPYSLASLGSSLPQFGPPNPSEINVSSRFDIGNTSAAPALLVNEDVELTDSLSWVHGAHTFKAGAEYLRLQYLNRSWFQAQGGFTFSGIFTGNAAADFLIGLPQTLSISTPQLEQGGLEHSSYYFFQDDWRISRRLTLNLGMRYELSLPWVQPNNYWGSFISGEQSKIYPNAPKSLVFPGDPGVPRGLIQTDGNNWAPRLGFAYDVFGDGKTAVRGGVGVFYDAVTANIIQNGTQPFRYSYTINAPYSLTNPLKGYPAIPTGVNLSNPAFTTNPPPQLTFPSPTMRTPYTYQYNLTVQRQIINDLVVEVAYVGKLGRKLLTDISVNPAIYLPGATVANENSRVVYPGFGALSEMGTFANSAYNALQTRVNKRYSRNLLFQGTYTFSKSMDDSSSSTTDTAAIPNPFNVQAEWAPSDFYAKHIASAALIYDLPKLLNRNVFLRETAGGWNFSLRWTARSGNPVNILTGQDNALSGTPKQRPNVKGSPILPGNRSTAEKNAEWFNTSVFSFPAAGTYGDLGRNVIIGPGLNSTNVALMKNFPLGIREGMYLQFRTEAFSVFNTPIFSSPGATLGSSLGKITSTSGGDRHLQFALKVGLVMRTLMAALLAATTLNNPDALRTKIQQTFHVPNPLPALDTEKHGSFEVEKGIVADRVTYNTQLNMRVPAIVYHPANVTNKRPAIIIVNGHGGDKYTWYAFYAGVMYARAGAVVLTYDPIGEGERNSQHKSGTRAHDKYVPPDENGRWMGGLMMTDIRQAASYLILRHDVDPNRIAVTGYSMGSFLVSWACAVETRLHACAPTAGAVLDGPGETLDSSSKKMCQAIPYQSLQFLGDRGAMIFALAAQHAAVLIHNGSADEVVNIPTHGEAFFKDMQGRTAKLLGPNAKPFTYSFTPDGGHRPYFITRPVAEWFNQQLHFPDWNAISRDETHISEWAEANGVPMDKLYATEHREGGAIALGKNIPNIPHDKLNVLPESEWQTQKDKFILETWLARVRQASSPAQ